MELTHLRCAGVDVHKKSITVCLVTRDEQGVWQSRIRKFGTMTGDLMTLVDALRTNRCPVVGMESTGVYWKPVYNILEAEGIQVILTNPTDIRNRPGYKTDMADRHGRQRMDR